MKCQRIIDIMEKLAPKRLAEEWDNPGLLAGSMEQEVTKILVCLDVSLPVAEKAVEAGAQLIIAHHPMIFKGIRHIRTDTYEGKMFQLLLSHNIAVYAAHTNLDIADGGVNDVLANLIGLEKIKGFVPMEYDKEAYLGRIGELPEAISLTDFADRVKKGLGIQHLRLVRGNDRPVKKIALCSGAGAEFTAKAAFKGADVYLTGDVKYHEAQQAVQQGINLIDAGHFPTEFPVVKTLAAYLQQELAQLGASVAVVQDDVSRDFFEFA